ncbi:MAG: hypothetical protein SGILL_001197 [Bacillariaceae sp.]
MTTATSCDTKTAMATGEGTSTISSDGNKGLPGPYKLPSRVDGASRRAALANASSSCALPVQELQKARQDKKSATSESNPDDTDTDCKENQTVLSPTVTVVANSPIRKRLGCRRVEDDMITSDDEDEDGNEIEDTALRRKLFFTSPRLMEPDDSLFPANHSPYKKSDDRWKQISEQAGSHRQDGTVITIGRKITPMALRIGMTKQAAGRVRALNLWLDHDKDVLPDWLDVIAQTFVNLDHLTLTEDVFPGEDEMAVSARMRRLYILYRLPYLKSIDDVGVSAEERRLARPNDCDLNGDKVVIESQWCSLLDKSNHSRTELENNAQYITTDECSGKEESWGKSRPPTGQQHRLAHEMPVETINDKYSLGVINDGLCGDENDGLGRIPRIPATMSNVSTRTAKEVGVEINQELVAKFAELNCTSTATTAGTMSENFDEILDDEFAGVAMLSDLAASSEEVEASENRDSDDFSTSVSGDDENDDTDIGVFGIASPSKDSAEIRSIDCHGNTVEMDLVGQANQLPTRYDVPTVENLEGRKKGVRSQILDGEDNSIELISVASTDLEWNAACGILSFRNGRACAPRLRMPFARNRKVLAADDAVRAIRQAKANVRSKQREKEHSTGKPCTPVCRNDTVETPQVGCCTFGKSSKPKFFSHKSSSIASSASANKQLPPSKSLSSPFPMQFRERQKAPVKTQLVVKTSESTSSEDSRRSREMDTISSPLQSIDSIVSSSPKGRDQKRSIAAKGDLPPTCPTAPRRKVPMAPSAQARKSQRKQRQIKAAKKNARSTSMMDLEEDEEEAEVDEIALSRSTDSAVDEIILTRSTDSALDEITLTRSSDSGNDEDASLCENESL